MVQVGLVKLIKHFIKMFFLGYEAKYDYIILMAYLQLYMIL